MRVRSIVLPAVVGLSALASPALAGGCVNCYRHVVTPPVYGSVAEQVMVRAPRTVAHAIPGEYGSVAESVLVSPPRKVWQVTRGPHGEAIGCWVVIPAQFAVRHRTVEVRAPQVVHETIPAAYATHHRTVVVQPGSSGWQPIGGGFGGHGGLWQWRLRQWRLRQWRLRRALGSGLRRRLGPRRALGPWPSRLRLRRPPWRLRRSRLRPSRLRRLRRGLWRQRGRRARGSGGRRGRRAGRRHRRRGRGGRRRLLAQDPLDPRRSALLGARPLIRARSVGRAGLEDGG